MQSISIFAFIACLAFSTANAASVIMYAGNGGHTPDQVMNGAPPSANNGWLVVDGSEYRSRYPAWRTGWCHEVERLGVCAGDVLYGSTINGNTTYPPPGPTPVTSDLVQINPNNGSFVADIGTIKANGTALQIADLAVQPGTGMLFGISAAASTNSTAPGFLYTINTTTGAATLVGNTGDFFGALAFAPNGTLYMLSADLDMTTGDVINQEVKTLNPSDAQTLTMSGIPFTAPNAPLSAF